MGQGNVAGVPWGVPGRGWRVRVPRPPSAPQEHVALLRARVWASGLADRVHS